MEHCPYPQDPLYPKVKIPYLEHPPFDNGVFWSYPARQGWDKREFLTGKLTSGPPERAAAFLQTWLFFGLARSILGSTILKDAIEFFVRDDPDKPGAKVISTERLNEALEQWAGNIMDLGEDEIKITLEHVGKCLDEASFIVRATESPTSTRSDLFKFDESYPQVRFSIMLLGDHLWSSIRALENELDGRIHTAAKAVTNIVGKKSYLGKMVGKLEKTATKAIQSKHKFNFNYPAMNPQPFELQEQAPEHDYEMRKALMAALLHDSGWHRGRPAVGWPSWGTSGLIRSRMMDAGWCKFEAERAQDIMSPWATHFACALRWPMLPRWALEPKSTDQKPDTPAHGEKPLAPEADMPILEHTGCSGTHCEAHNIDGNTYKTRHVTKDCNCEFIGLPEEDVRNLFKQDGERFPLIKATLDTEAANGEEELSLSVANGGTGETKFIALSHVWSHGLGNAKENKLPRCQFVRLVKLIYDNRPGKQAWEGNFGGPSGIRKEGSKIIVWIWIDTICVPLEPEYRKLAINRMSRTYGTCAFLWVLDLGLVPISIRATTQTEALIRIYCSTWMQRMWTLQEGAAKNTRIIFADGLVGTMNVSHEVFTRPSQPIARRGWFFDLIMQMDAAAWRPLTSVVYDGFNWRKSGLDVHMPDCSRLTRIWNGLAWRSSTKSSDQPLILAALVFGKFQFNPTKPADNGATSNKPQNEYQISEEKLKRVVSSPSRERWLTFYKEHAACPQGIMFVNCPTLPDPCYRWAPCEIGTTDRTIVDQTPGLVTPTGFVVKLPGYKLFSLPAESGPDGFSFVDTTRKEWFSVRPMRDGELLHEIDPPSSFGFYAIILGSLVATHEEMPGLLVTTEGNPSTSKNGVLNARFGRKVFVTRMLSEEEADLNAKATRMPQLVVRTERYENTQTWCVG